MNLNMPSLIFVSALKFFVKPFFIVVSALKVFCKANFDFCQGFICFVCC